MREDAPLLVWVVFAAGAGAAGKARLPDSGGSEHCTHQHDRPSTA